MKKVNYLSELELKSLIIRVKNAHISNNTVKTGKTVVDNSHDSIKNNSRINRMIKWYISLEKNDGKKAKALRRKLKEKIISLSEQTSIDKLSYEIFGSLILKIISHIISQNKFSGYSYHDEFTSDAIQKILKYSDNFDHTKISKTTKQPVSAFAYITQIVNNSILFIINKMKVEQDFIQSEINSRRLALGLPVTDYDRQETKMFSVSSISEIYKIIDREKTFLKNNVILIKHNMTDIEDFQLIYVIQKTYKNLMIIGDEHE